jgi:hypothetical protein
MEKIILTDRVKMTKRYMRCKRRGKACQQQKEGRLTRLVTSRVGHVIEGKRRKDRSDGKTRKKA